MIHKYGVKHVLRYLKGTAGLGLVFGGKDSKGAADQSVGFSDASHGGDAGVGAAQHRSTSGYIFLWQGGPISWASRRQKSVARSTAEVEYLAAAEATREALWLTVLLAEQTGLPEQCVQMRTDNKAAELTGTTRLSCGMSASSTYCSGSYTPSPRKLWRRGVHSGLMGGQGRCW